jgi:CoA:oxalate CoA-transferase
LIEFSNGLSISNLRRNASSEIIPKGNPIKLSGYEDATTRPPAPALDGDRQAILDWLGLN